MRVFQTRELHEAIAHAVAGGVAIHLHSFVTARAPLCFRQAVQRGEQIAHLFCRDEALLRETARRLGVKVVVIERRGTAKMHIDLCSGPLRKALAEAKREE